MIQQHPQPTIGIPTNMAASRGDKQMRTRRAVDPPAWILRDHDIYNTSSSSVHHSDVEDAFDDSPTLVGQPDDQITGTVAVIDTVMSDSIIHIHDNVIHSDWRSPISDDDGPDYKDQIRPYVVRQRQYGSHDLVGPDADDDTMLTKAVLVPTTPDTTTNRRADTDFVASNSNSTMVEVVPGLHMRLRGAAETVQAMQRNTLSPPMICSTCASTIFCIRDATHILCPTCFLISPVTNHPEADDNRENGDGNECSIGLGFTDDVLHQYYLEMEAESTRS